MIFNSEHHNAILLLLRLSSHGVKEVINYQAISPKDLAKSVLSEGGWSNFMVLFHLKIHLFLSFG